MGSVGFVKGVHSGVTVDQDGNVWKPVKLELETNISSLISLVVDSNEVGVVGKSGLDILLLRCYTLGELQRNAKHFTRVIGTLFQK